MKPRWVGGPAAEGWGLVAAAAREGEEGCRAEDAADEGDEADEGEEEFRHVVLLRKVRRVQGIRNASDARWVGGGLISAGGRVGCAGGRMCRRAWGLRHPDREGGAGR